MVNEDLIMEIVRPGTGDPVAPGDVGEIVVTSLDPHHPWIRLAIGDLTAALPGPSPCGRSNMRIKGWMGRADQTTKVKGMFVRPEQIAEIGKRHPELGRLRLVVTREDETDVMTLKCECASPGGALQARSPRRCARWQSSAAMSNWSARDRFPTTARSLPTSASRPDRCRRLRPAQNLRTSSITSFCCSGVISANIGSDRIRPCARCALGNCSGRALSRL